MGIFNKKKTQTPDNSGDFLKEYSNSDGINAYNFIQGIRVLDSNYINNENLLDRMTQDSIISSAVDMWTEDALQKDPQTKEIFHIELNTPENYVETALSKGLTQELESFLKDDLRMDKNLTPILKRVLIYGGCPVKLDFADALVDDKLELKESEMEEAAKISSKLIDAFGNTKDTTIKSLEDSDRQLNEGYSTIDWEQFSEDIVSDDNSQLKKLQESLSNRYNSKSLNESQDLLREDELINVKKMIKGRWYTDNLGSKTELYQLVAKQKVIAYIDRDNPNKFIRADRIAYFNNNTGKHKINFEIGDRNESIDKKKYYQLERGESFLENSMAAWQVLSALEDILLLTRMTRSILYRIFSVEVGNKGNKETKDLLERLKNKIKTDETVDIRSKIYNSSLRQVPLGDSIFIPTRNGVGVIDVKTVGGDVNLHDAIDLDYFKDKLFAGLRIPAPFLGFTESLPGGIGDTSLTRMDIRYSRTISRIQSILAEGLKDLCLIYLKMTRTEQAFNELPDFKVVFTSINSAEDASRAELKSTQIQTLKDILEGLKGLGVDISANSEGYEKTRQQLIKEYFGSTLLDKILIDEKSMVVQAPTEGNTNDLGDSSDLGGGEPNDIISGPSNLDNSNEEPTEEENNNEEQPEEQNIDAEIDNIEQSEKPRELN